MPKESKKEKVEEKVDEPVLNMAGTPIKDLPSEKDKGQLPGTLNPTKERPNPDWLEPGPKPFRER